MERLSATFRDQAIQAIAGQDSQPPSLSLSTIRSAFPIAGKRAYLNNASIGPISEPVMTAVQAFLEDVRDHGRNNYPVWCDFAENNIKSHIGALIGASSHELAFVKNTTEGLVTVANGLDWRSGDTVVLPRIEYPSNVYCWMRLARYGVSIRWVDPIDGRFPISAFTNAFDASTRLVSVSAVQFSNGYRHDIAELADLCRRRRVLLNLDGIQYAGALRLDLTAIHVDFLSFGGHKWMLAPIGTGVFYCNERSLGMLSPPTMGYHTIAKSEAHLDYDIAALRPGAARFEAALENFPGLWGLDAAVKIQLGLGSRAIERHILELTKYATERLRSKGWRIVSPRDERECSGLLSFTADDIDVGALELRLRDAGVDIAVRDGRFRLSPSYYNDRSDIDRLVEALPDR
jgi:selenocysteine lyase/cysteine desulfurase